MTESLPKTNPPSLDVFRLPKFEETRLLRTGRIQWKDDPKLADASWEERWLLLSLQRKTPKNPVDAFWHRIGGACITQICQIAPIDEGKASMDDEIAKIATISLPEDADKWIESAPPMLGGEFLTHDMLALLWEKLLAQCQNECRLCGGIAKFLETRASQWNNVGRIFFHLAENKMSQDFPFAFLATYTYGLNDKGEPKHLPLSNALTLYGKNPSEKPKLLRLLHPLLQATRRFDWVRDMVAQKTIYQARPWTADQAYRFLKSCEGLEEAGVGVRLPNWWKKRSRPQIKAVFNAETPSRLRASALVNIDLQVMIGEHTYSASEIEALLAESHDGLVFFKGQWIELDKEKLEQALSYWKDMEEMAQSGDLTFSQALRTLSGLPNMEENEEEAEEIREWSFTEAGRGFKELLDAARTELHGDIPDLHATLRPYQSAGVAWLSFMGRLGLGCCLADDMGLGKTIQILALLLKEKGRNASLLIAPASLLRNWQSEIKRFAPTLSALLLHGLSKKDLEAYAEEGAFDGYDLVLTSYAGATKMPWLGGYPWNRVICDEAQAIKNPQTKQSKTIRAIKQGAHIALTGTPIENRLTDLWAIFDFLNPGLLGTSREFSSLVKYLESSNNRFAPLRRLTQPYILRRMKTDKNVIDCLPDKTEMPLSCQLTKAQAKIYVSIANTLKKTLESLGKAPEDVAKRRMIVLQSLMLLKQVCNHPTQALGEGKYDPKDSGKFLAVRELCETIASRQEKVLVFTQFQKIIEPLANYLAEIFGQPGLVMHGAIPVKARQDIVNEFQSPDGPPFLVLTLKVGGTGLTLTEANHVIHFDRWWNPAVEDQATDRAFRIGQKKNVLVHKCISRGTLEEKIDALIQDKRDLAHEVLGNGNEISFSSMSDKEIFDLVRLDASQIAE